MALSAKSLPPAAGENAEHTRAGTRKRNGGALAHSR